jgi:hypothetical protein
MHPPENDYQTSILTVAPRGLGLKAVDADNVGVRIGVTGEADSVDVHIEPLDLCDRPAANG